MSAAATEATAAGTADNWGAAVAVEVSVVVGAVAVVVAAAVAVVAEVHACYSCSKEIKMKY